MNSTFPDSIGEPPRALDCGGRAQPRRRLDACFLAAPRLASRRAFTLIEILVVVTLLSIIVLGLLAMFTQTQRAFRTGLTQADVLEAGRVAGDLLRRELEQITPTQLSNTVNFEAWYPNYRPLEQPLPGSAALRTNMLEDLFFVTRGNRTWTGIGYFVRTNLPTATQILVGTPTVNIGQPSPDYLSAGTLYRFEATVADVPPRGGPDYLYFLYRSYAYANTWALNSTNVARIVDGVVQFKVRAYNTNGLWITNNSGPNGVSYSGSQYNTTNLISTRVPGEMGQYRFVSNAVPAAVELELGILEDKSWERFKNLPTDTARHTYLTNVVGRVHLFRHRVQVRNVDPVAYQ